MTLHWPDTPLTARAPSGPPTPRKVGSPHLARALPPPGAAGHDPDAPSGTLSKHAFRSVAAAATSAAPALSAVSVCLDFFTFPLLCPKGLLLVSCKTFSLHENGNRRPWSGASPGEHPGDSWPAGGTSAGRALGDEGGWGARSGTGGPWSVSGATHHPSARPGKSRAVAWAEPHSSRAARHRETPRPGRSRAGASGRRPCRASPDPALQGSVIKDRRGHAEPEGSQSPSLP